MDSINERLSVVKTRITLQHPFWAVIALNVEFISDALFPWPAATDCGKKVWVNPDICAKFDDMEFMGLMLHELFHIVFLTSIRRGGRDPELWNEATDYAINLIIVDEMKYKIPEGGCYDLKYTGMSAEEIYDLLEQEQKKQPKTGYGSGKGKKGVGEKTGKGGGGKPDQGESNPGSGGGDQYVPGGKRFDLHLPEPAGLGVEQEIKDIIAQAKAVWDSAPSDRRGTIPGVLKNYLDKLLKPHVPWERELHRYAGQVIGRDDYSMSPPHRRYLMDDLIVPAAKSYHIGRLVVAIDSSGSVYTKKVQTQFASEVAKLASLCEETTVIVCDAHIQQVIKTRDIAAFLGKLEVKGGGGTSHIPVFEEIKKQRMDPELLICLTDGETIFPDRKPGYPVLWCLTQEGGNVPWGRKVFVDV